VRIAICDDEPLSRAQLLKSIIACEDVTSDVNVADFGSGASLVESHLATPFNIIVLDIEMDGMSGVEAAQTIRGADNDVIIIFFTGHLQYAQQSFGIGVFDYILKSDPPGAICDVLGRALRKYEEQHHMLKLGGRDSTHLVEANEIIYFVADQKNVKYITASGRLFIDGTITEYENRLSQHGFIRCHHKYLVNMAYIKSIGKSEITTKQGHKIPISTRRKQDCLRIYGKYLLRYMV